MLLLIFVPVFLFVVDAHIKFTECQAEYYRSLPGNEDVVFETDGKPCQNKRKRRGLISENVISRWDNVIRNGSRIVPYFFEDGYEKQQYDYFYDYQYVHVKTARVMEIIEEMLDLFKKHTCVEFLRLKTEEEKKQYDYKIVIVADGHNNGSCGAWSRLGRLPYDEQPQRLNICPRVMAPYYGYHNTSVLHEAMHALGFHHEQTRADRDDYVEIHPSLKGNADYVKLPAEIWTDTGSPYDFDSIMHYPSKPVESSLFQTLFGSDEYDISVPGSNYKTPITANRVYPFSEEDIKQINYAYCSGEKTLSKKSVKILMIILIFFSL